MQILSNDRIFIQFNQYIEICISIKLGI